MQSDLEAYFQAVTSYYLDSLMATQQFGVVVLSGIIAGTVFLFGLASIVLDIMYYRRRSNPTFKKLTVVSWCSCCAVRNTS